VAIPRYARLFEYPRQATLLESIGAKGPGKKAALVGDRREADLPGAFDRQGLEDHGKI
jgi:hypothetical protein